MIYPTDEHRQTSIPGNEERTPEIGTIIRKYFLKDAPNRPATLARLRWQGSIASRAGHTRTNGVPTIGRADFRCETRAMAGL